MTSRITAPSTRLVLVGGGPRAIGVLERLAASAAQPPQAARLQRTPLHVDVIDPHMPGAGRIWRAEESPLLLMNSRAADVSIHTDPTVEIEGPVRAGPSLAEWAEGIRRGTIEAPTSGTARLAEIEALQPEHFASRRVQALYLEWFFGQVLAALPTAVTVTVHRTTATAVRRAGEGWSVELEDRDALSADLLLLAAGHTDARPSAARHRLAAFARRHGGTYLAPAQASDVPLAQLAPGQDVIVRGMGLAFVDLMALLTEGRGGEFVADPQPGEPDRLAYRPSGREPRLWAGSRRGVPYHSKVRDEGADAGLGELAHVTPAALAAREDADGLLDFRSDVVPLIAAEIHRQVPGAPLAAPGEEPLAWLDDPLAWLEGEAHPQVTRDAVVRHIEQDLHARTRGDVTPARALFQLLLRLHGVLVDQLPATRLRGGAGGAYPRWWHSLFSFVDSGPPPHRLHQMLALERAGVLRFLGPRVHVTAEETTGRFTARGAAGVQVTADALVDAFLPEPSLAESTNPLLRNLVAGGEDAVGRESAATPGALEVDAGHRVIAPDGTARPSLWAVGPWTSELPIGAFARPHTNAPCHRRNDALARVLLEAALHRGEARLSPASGHDGAVTAATTATAATAAAALTAVTTVREDAAEPERATDRSPRSPRAPRLGVLGPGKIGRALARTALRRGVEVQVTGRAPAAALSATLPGARAVDLAELTAASDVVALTVPLHVALSLDPSALDGAVVIDATNPWGEADAAAVAAARETLGDTEAELSTSELLAAHLPGARLVKTLNHIGYHDVEEHGRPDGDTVRRAIALAADDPQAAAAVAQLLHRIGYEPVRVGTLAEGRELEPGAGLFSGWCTREELGLRRAAQVRAA
ncbi:FAD/NAD(P)-binding protein [Brachybacterium saurashtrense]|uniref:DNA-binding protein n=1 Tax=Brachybacterium saurashtrense TaxID=556288 RepID=A0A345YSD1_9MICO|nr:FAD/NAD(P)-binding protein [Brachybacterium saurashtrense]AXK46833.1 DNA-binding protein [Brachybacterium saurashtrense]RRR22548.1 DNA-binding protein [Brachybacterium saurashtrense]